MPLPCTDFIRRIFLKIAEDESFERKTNFESNLSELLRETNLCHLHIYLLIVTSSLT